MQIEAEALPVTAATLASLPEFSAITLNPSEAASETKNGISRPEVAKTGLGSSAAMTSAVVAGILEYLGSVKLPLHAEGQVSSTADGAWNLDLVHSIAQAAHSAAQGKIGSGFDVSSAVYGSQRYIRFSPSVLSAKVFPIHVHSFLFSGASYLSTFSRNFYQQVSEVVSFCRKLAAANPR